MLIRTSFLVLYETNHTLEGTVYEHVDAFLSVEDGAAAFDPQ